MPHFEQRDALFKGTILFNSLEVYFDPPREQRLGAAWSVQTFKEEMRHLGLGNSEMATMIMILCWGINTNTPKASFWMLAYLLHNPTLMPLIRDEIAPAFVEGVLDINYLTSSCPRLTGIWLETLRLASSSASVRFITEDTVINGKLLRKGNRLMIPYRQLHFNESVFGEDVGSFDPMRFADSKRLARSTSWRPFGGGQTLCPGRFVAQQTVLTFIAILLHRFDIELSEPQRFPKADEGKPVLGIMETLDDVTIRIRNRGTCH